MLPGSKKRWGSKTRDFWCCFGTMVQAQTIYPELVWYTDGKDVTVSQYFPSEAEMDLEYGKVQVRQAVHMKNYDNQVLFDEHSGGRVSRWSIRFTVKSEGKGEWALRLRVPAWIAGEPVVSVNGKEIKAEIEEGYIVLARNWGEEEVVDVFFPSEVRFEKLDGAEELMCAVDGPIVLAGLVDKDCGITGNLDDPESILLPELSHTYGAFVWTQNGYLTRKQKENFRLVPLYEVTNEAYTVYFTSES